MLADLFTKGQFRKLREMWCYKQAILNFSITMRRSVEKDIVMEPFIYTLLLIYSDVIMCCGRYAVTLI